MELLSADTLGEFSRLHAITAEHRRMLDKNRRRTVVQPPLPNAVWERSSRAFSDARVRASEQVRGLLQAQVRGRPSPGRGLWGPSDLSRADARERWHKRCATD